MVNFIEIRTKCFFWISKIIAYGYVIKSLPLVNPPRCSFIQAYLCMSFKLPN